MPLLLWGRQPDIGTPAGQATPPRRSPACQADHRVSLSHQLSAGETQASKLCFIQIQKKNESAF